MSEIDAAARAIADGDLVVYPTETVYGLGADALDSDAVERVYAVKGRPRDDPLSLGVPDVDAATDYTAPTARERRFMHEFLPGPVTVIVDRREMVPDELTSGLDRVGVRVPDHATAREFLAAADTPVTATSANVSGNPSVRRAGDLDGDIQAAVAAVIDGGETPGTESTVVDVAAGEIHRRGANADAIDAWLADN